MEEEEHCAKQRHKRKYNEALLIENGYKVGGSLNPNEKKTELGSSSEVFEASWGVNESPKIAIKRQNTTRLDFQPPQPKRQPLPTLLLRELWFSIVIYQISAKKKISDDPAFLPLRDVVFAEDLLHLGTKHAVGGDLFDWFAQCKNNVELRTGFLYSFWCILKSVFILHQHQVTHGDLKFENFFRLQNQHLVLGDLDGCSLFPNIGSKQYTRSFVPPECIDTSKPRPMSYDAWSIGLFIHIFMTGGLFTAGWDRLSVTAISQGIVKWEAEWRLSPDVITRRLVEFWGISNPKIGMLFIELYDGLLTMNPLHRMTVSHALQRFETTCFELDCYPFVFSDRSSSSLPLINPEKTKTNIGGKKWSTKFNMQDLKTFVACCCDLLTTLSLKFVEINKTVIVIAIEIYCHFLINHNKNKLDFVATAAAVLDVSLRINNNSLNVLSQHSLIDWIAHWWRRDQIFPDFPIIFGKPNLQILQDMYNIQQTIVRELWFGNVLTLAGQDSAKIFKRLCFQISHRKFVGCNYDWRSHMQLLNSARGPLFACGFGFDMSKKSPKVHRRHSI
jgi:serine/threonine protein kinase